MSAIPTTNHDEGSPFRPLDPRGFQTRAELAAAQERLLLGVGTVDDKAKWDATSQAQMAKIIMRT